MQSMFIDVVFQLEKQTKDIDWWVYAQNKRYITGEADAIGSANQTNWCWLLLFNEEGCFA